MDPSSQGKCVSVDRFDFVNAFGRQTGREWIVLVLLLDDAVFLKWEGLFVKKKSFLKI